jgi:hypothetical protein
MMCSDPGMHASRKKLTADVGSAVVVLACLSTREGLEDEDYSANNELRRKKRMLR